MNEAMRHSHSHDHHHDAHRPSRTASSLRASTLRQSALQRLVVVAFPILGLWLAVAFALDLFA